MLLVQLNSNSQLVLLTEPFGKEMGLAWLGWCSSCAWGKWHGNLREEANV